MTSEASVEEVPASEGSAGPDRAAVGRVLGSVAAYLVFRSLLGWVQLPERTPGAWLAIVSVLVAAGGIGLPILVIVSLVRWSRSVATSLAVMAAGLALWLGPSAALHGRNPAVEVGQDLGKILTGAGVGVSLAGALRDPNLLFPAGLFAALADFVVVNFGTVKRVLTHPKEQPKLDAMSAHLPSVHAHLPALTIGLADFLFLGILLACAARFRFGLARNGWALAAVLSVSLLLVPVVRAIPALAPMCLTFVAINGTKMRLSRQEVVNSLVVVGLAGALFFGYFRFFFH